MAIIIECMLPLRKVIIMGSISSLQKFKRETGLIGASVNLFQHLNLPLRN